MHLHTSAAVAEAKVITEHFKEIKLGAVTSTQQWRVRAYVCLCVVCAAHMLSVEEDIGVVSNDSEEEK